MRDGWIAFVLFVLVMVMGFLIGVIVVHHDQDLLSKEEFERNGYSSD